MIHRSPLPDVEIPADRTAEGILLAMGSSLGGFALYLLDGKLRYVHNLYGKERHVVGSDVALTAGPHQLVYEFTKTTGLAGHGELRVDGTVVGAGDIPTFTPMQFSHTGGGMTCGYEVGPSVGDDYVAPFRCNATIRRVVVEVEGAHERDPMAVFRQMMAEQ